MSERQNLLRHLPAVDRVLREAELQALTDQLSADILAEAVHQHIDYLRRQLLGGGASAVAGAALEPAAIANAAAAYCRDLLKPSLRKVINATGTLLHTNLGRAPLAPQALRAIHDVASGYSTLEMDMSNGKRGERYRHVERLLCRLTGAEAALVVNNNAGAVLLALTALGRGREAIVSRGELVEIGGAFRIPEVMEAGGVLLREVGSTNRTHRRDYVQAITEQTAILLKVHTSNYRIVGFSGEVTSAELVGLGREHQLIVMEDLGSGLLTDLSSYGLAAEPTVGDVVRSGVDVVTFSGDKLLGGPQAGLIVGRKDLIRKIAKHPLARALRIDKLTLAALETTLRLYLQPCQAARAVPVLSMFAAELQQQKGRCETLRQCLLDAPVAAEVTLVEDVARVGGGAMPLTELADWAVAIRPHHLSVAKLAARLRDYTPALIARIRDDALLVNLRAVFAAEDCLLAQLLVAALVGEESC
ncbi:L-seryl-tRNA(Sec) selenium transferase [Pelovirga terrestris]|uniref:L-seryl-tRNA(Sec) selenium transferase n=1 Tax=Pelovirga terrestris TaxID=2771352 RepID=A0A8J6UKF8_9BACT|nr:L-seryl-tRNA(Sec) selenium transferase [Pelovirga terrestris]MBD1399362.1 L-seryl-tRNA(Sec) selenium transferase [Pelovirga terrestris]